MSADTNRPPTDHKGQQFEAIACIYDGLECWSARELYPILGYAKWQTFENVLSKAREACSNAGIEVSDHFTDASKMVDIGSGAKKDINDLMLTRYACYLVAQNGDPRKPEIAFAQNYFAVQTRVAEVIEHRLLEYDRVQARHKLAETEKRLSGVLYERGVDDKGFGIIRSKGDQALFRMKDFAAEMFFVRKMKKSLKAGITMPDHIRNHKNFIMSADPVDGIISAPDLAACISKPGNKLYDREYARKNGISFFVNPNALSYRLTCAVQDSNLVPDAFLNSINGEDYGRQFLHENGRFFTDYFFNCCRQYDL